MKSFAQLYAAQHRLQPDEVERDVFRRCLYPHARLLRPFIEIVAPLHFAADIDMISDVAQLTDVYEFFHDVYAHQHHPKADGICRRCFFLRMSVGRLRRLVWNTFHAGIAPAPGIKPDRTTHPAPTGAR